MLLRSLEIRNYRSLEHMRLEGLSEFNVLIGRNNAGKSAILNALIYLASTVFQAPGLNRSAPDVGVLTDHDPTRDLAFDLTFALREEDREQFVDLLIQAGHAVDRRPDLLKSQLLRQVAFSFSSPPGQPTELRLDEGKALTEDGHWVTVMAHDESASSPFVSDTVVGITSRVRQHPTDPLGVDMLSLGSPIGGASSTRVKLSLRDDEIRTYKGQVDVWVFWRLAQFFAEAFFFSPFRHSREKLPAEPTGRLTADGTNLPVVLNYLSGDDRSSFERIEQFVHAALPDVGSLHAGLIRDEGGLNNQVVRITFQSPEGYRIGLHEVGGGVEQLLMAGVALATTHGRSTLFLEEPESHLHPGAQRHLMEQLRSGGRQVFVTTHSPIFVNARPPGSLYQVKRTSGRTAVTRLRDPAALAEMLEDIDARNSDVLLSDAVLFVEGPTDRDVVVTWSRTLETSLDEHNVTVLSMGGGRHAERQAPARSEVLEGVSAQSPIPHLFLLDRDERSMAEVENLQRQLGERLRVLERREVENYLLVPQAVIAAIAEKHRDDAPVRERVEAATPEEAERLIHATADGLFGLVLLKRIRAELGGLRDGLLPTEVVTELAARARDPDLALLVRQAVEGQVADRISDLGITELVQSQREALEREWADKERHAWLAPGEEVLTSMFRHFGSEFNKRTDAPRIARAMPAEDIDPEIREVLSRATELTVR